MRMGMWVVVRGKIGIVSSLEPLLVDLVDSKGETIETVPGAGARQAKLAEIPKCRRPAKAAVKHLGYV